MKRLLIQTFVVLYTAFSVMVIVEHTSSWAFIFADTAKSRITDVRPITPHQDQKWMVEYPFAGSLGRVTSALPKSETDKLRPLSARFVNDANPTIASRAPPTRFN